MKAKTQYLNPLLVKKAKHLSASEEALFKKVFGKSNLMLRFFEFLKTLQKDDFSTEQAVRYLYNSGRKDDLYAQYENRYYKLRKKLYEHFYSKTLSHALPVTQQEEKHFEIRALINSGQHQLASAELHFLLCSQRNTQ